MKVFAFRTVVSRLAAQCVALLLSLLMVSMPVAGQSGDDAGSRSSKPSAKAHAKKNAGKQAAGKSHKPASRHAQTSKAARAARTAAIRKAFTASADLRPMAQQLATLRTPEAYAGVAAFARGHSSEAAATAYLALGHAYLLDKRYPEAEAALRQSHQAGGELADYADFFAAQASREAGNNAAAEALLRGSLIDTLTASLTRRCRRLRLMCCWRWAMRRARNGFWPRRRGWQRKIAPDSNWRRATWRWRWDKGLRRNGIFASLCWASH